MRANRGKQHFFKAFRQYYATGGLDKASRIIKPRYEVNFKYKVCDEDIARFDLRVCTALLVNTAPAVFWAVLHIFSHQSLLNELRQDISASLRSHQSFTPPKIDGSGGPWRTEHQCVHPRSTSGSATNFIDAFWQFEKWAELLVFGLPSWLNTAGIKARDRMIAMCTRWYKLSERKLDWDAVMDSPDTNGSPYSGHHYLED
ncbi:hypothetical protein GGR51DRAFT_561940 [Nemania sp. FL0031]|nr:hypothetical protein GGR51DRAFT_561940 [Nemania sp. FL0031]